MRSNIITNYQLKIYLNLPFNPFFIQTKNYLHKKTGRPFSKSAGYIILIKSSTNNF